MADSSSNSAATVTQNSSMFTVDLPGVGSLTFTVDPATGALSNVVATADSGFTAGTPQVNDEGVQVSFTDASGAPTVLQAEVENEDGAIKVKPEVENQDGTKAPATSANPSGRDDNGETEANDDAGEKTAEQPAATQANQANHDDVGDAHQAQVNLNTNENEANESQANENEANENEANETPGNDDQQAPAMTTGSGSQGSTTTSSEGDGGGSDGGSGGHDGGSAGGDGGGGH